MLAEPQEQDNSTNSYGYMGTFGHMRTDLTGKRALVLGASQGIGRAIALEFASLGANVTIVSRESSSLEQVLSEMDRSRGQAHRLFTADMRRTDELAAGLDGHDPSRYDIVVNNTGGPAPGQAHEADVEAFADAFRLHLLAFQTVVRAVVPGMKERGHGRIINIISTSVKQPLPNLGVSNTIRGAVAQWSKTLAMELGPFGITVNNVLPGATNTERLSSIIRNKSSKTGIPEEEATRHMLDEIPLRRFAKPEEIAYAAAFLAGPSGSYINGINLPVDGGRTACL
jgi:3-oxoacyl-[acyl-carrier protein] reductase